MRLIHFIVFATALIGCANANNNTFQANKKSGAFMPDSPLKHLPEIGDYCTYRVNNDTIIGLLLSAIHTEEDSTYYIFFMSGKIFNRLPDFDEFENAGLWGLAVPGPGAGEYHNTLCGYDIEKKQLSSFLNSMTKVGKIERLSAKNETGSLGSFQPNLVAAEYGSFEKRNEQVKAEMAAIGFSPPVYKIFQWKDLRVADNDEDMARPETVWVLSPRSAHPKAAELMRESWWWSPIDDLTPFGNDSGHDAVYIFKEWRKDHLSVSPAAFLDFLEARWGMSFAHKNVVDEPALKIVEKNNQFYRKIDEAIIGIAFGQLVLEGTVDKDLKHFGIKAINRTLLPMGMEGMEESNKKKYTQRLNVMLDILNQF